jgi:transcriptional regulator with AAA-type ATPase domain
LPDRTKPVLPIVDDDAVVADTFTYSKAISRLMSPIRARKRKASFVSSTLAESGLLGRSVCIEKLRRQTGQFANAPFPVLIEGESGSGKELVARSLHLNSLSRRTAFRRPELRRDLADAARADAVRLREGRVHRRDEVPHRLFRGRQGFHAFSG